MNFSIPQNSNQIDAEKILIVDDCEDALIITKEFLLDAGYQVISCKSGEEALRIIQQEAVDAVLMDMAMPEMDGVTAAKKIKTLTGQNQFLPVIMVSALNDKVDKISGLEYADDYVTKPFSPEELVARIRTFLRIRVLHRDLIRSRENYRYLYDYFPHLVLTLDTQLKIVDCNYTFCSCLGINKEDVLGKEISSFISKQDWSAFQYFISKVRKDKTSDGSQTFEMSTSANNQVLVMETKAVLIEIEDSVERLLLSMVNITEKIRLEDERKIARRQLYRSAKLASIGSLASGVAHEVNNPLTAILGFASSILERSQNNEQIDSEELQRYLQIITNETLRCRDIVENLSRFARRDENVISEVSLSQCVQNTLKLVVSRATKRGICFNNSVNPDLTVKTDSNKLEQVLLNIFSNCIDFCSSNSEVDIFSYDKSGEAGTIRLKISDHGPGIAPEILSRVFDPFFSTKDTGYGAGMGLAICHRMMEDCCGKIDIYNNYETGGTTVVLEIPSIEHTLLDQL